MPLVRIDANLVRDWHTFHDVFAKSFGFPSFYGRNMDAWIDCMTHLGDRHAGMSTVHGSAMDPVVLHLSNVDSMPTEIYRALVDCSAIVNWRLIESGEPAILVLAFHRMA